VLQIFNLQKIKQFKLQDQPTKTASLLMVEGGVYVALVTDPTEDEPILDSAVIYSKSNTQAGKDFQTWLDERFPKQ